MLALAIAKDEDRVLTPSGLREGTPSPLPRKVPVPRPRHEPRVNLWPSLLPRPPPCPLPLPLPLPFLLLIKSSSGTSKDVAIQDKNFRPKVMSTALHRRNNFSILIVQLNTVDQAIKHLDAIEIITALRLNKV